VEGNLGTFTQWVQFVILVVGLISVLIRIGSTQGKQEEKNKNFEETQKIQREEIDVIKSDISIIKTDIAYIKGKLL
jgi:hypothetical protein